MGLDQDLLATLTRQSTDYFLNIAVKHTLTRAQIINRDRSTFNWV